MHAIEISNLVKNYGAQTALNDVSLTVGRGEIVGLLGPNGAGKTTLVECVAGLRAPDAGAVRVLGMHPRRERTRLRERVGVQLQSCALPEHIRLEEAMQLYSSLYAHPADWRELVDSLGLTGQRKVRFNQLSGGQRQRLSIAMALVGNPELAILDELSTGLDPHSRRDAWMLLSQLRERGVAILLVTHALEEAEALCDRIAIMQAGRLTACDTPSRLIGTLQSAQIMRFRPSQPLPDSVLLALPEVHSVLHAGAHLRISGSPELASAVLALLSREQIIAHDLRIETPSLDDAFAALTAA